MKGVCAIVLDEDGAFLSLGALKKGSCSLLGELEVPLVNKSSALTDYLRENLEALGRAIKEADKKHSLNTGKIFLELPDGLCNKKIVEETVSLKRDKKITSRDIAFVKKSIEDKFLNWDDSCVHNIVLNYEAGACGGRKLPLGVRAKKIKIQSLLLWVKEKLYKEVEDIFDNLDRDFAGFVASSVSVFSTSFISGRQSLADEALPRVAVSIDYNQSRFTAVDKDGFVYDDGFDFGLKKIIEELSKRFMFPFTLAQEVFNRYISFKEIPYFKEITVKKDSSYMNLSTQALNSFTKNYVAGSISSLMNRIKEKIKSDKFIVSFGGRLNAKEGFYGFLKDCVFTELKTSAHRPALSSSSGCLHYGVSRFMEKDHKNRRPFFQYISSVYKDYF